MRQVFVCYPQDRGQLIVEILAGVPALAPRENAGRREMRFTVSGLDSANAEFPAGHLVVEYDETGLPTDTADRVTAVVRAHVPVPRPPKAPSRLEVLRAKAAGGTLSAEEKDEALMLLLGRG